MRILTTAIMLLLVFLHTMVMGAPAVDTTLPEQPMVLHTKSGDIFATLTLPVAAHPPIVLIVAGSGPTDRNGNGPGFQNNSYLQLAHDLASRGIASLRFDKRGIAESRSAGLMEANLRFETYVEDAVGWIQLLKADRRFSQIIVAGHSEGALIGLLASQTNVDKYVSIAGPGQPIDKTIETQLSRQPKEIQEICSPILDSLRLGKMVANIDPRLQSLFRPSVQPYLISWMKYDPAKVISQLKIPALIIQGTADLQVQEQDAQLLKRADPGAMLALIDHMNHVMKIVADDPQANMAAYNNPSLPISEKLVQLISQFIQSRPANNK